MLGRLQPLRAQCALLARPSGRAAFSTSKRVFPTYVKYAPQASFQMQPIAPTYVPVQGREYLKNKRTGSIMMSWAAMDEQSKHYNYDDKVFFFLNPNEVGLVLEVLDTNLAEVSLTHSPNVNAQLQQQQPGNAEKMRRSLLDVKRLVGPDGHPKTEFNLSTTNAADMDITVKVSLNAGEARVVRELLVYSLPRLYGFHSVLEGPLVIDRSSDGGDGTPFNSNGNSRPPRGTSGNAPEWPF